MLVLIRKKGVEYLNTAYLDMIQGKNPGVTPVWYMRQAGRSQAEYRKIKEKYTLFEITKEPELCARVTELPRCSHPLQGYYEPYGRDECKRRAQGGCGPCV